MMLQSGFFDLQDRYKKLSELGDPLERLNETIPWEAFRPVLSKAHNKQRKSKAGRKPYDSLLLFKILILQSLYNLSDEQMEYQIRDRLSFMRFLELRMEDKVPDATTVWLYRERLVELGLLDTLFKRFAAYLDAEGYQAKKGQIIDASIVEVPKQRNDRDENRRIKEGEVPEDWSDAKRRQKDVQARWTKKHGKSYYGYKNHIGIDRKNKLIRQFKVSDASVHDSQVLDEIVDPENSGADLWADSAYRSEETEVVLKAAGYRSQINFKGSRNKALTEWQQECNRMRSRVRARVEHVFGYQQNSMGGKFVRTIGIARAGFKIGMMNLTYNLMRYLQLEWIKEKRSVPAVA